MNEVFKYDYYRMTGNSYSFSFKAKFRLFYIINLNLCIYGEN